MTFLAPLFLLGALAIALPVIFHLVRRTTRERAVYSSLMFLRPAAPRLTRRSRLEHVLLLLLRCTVLALLALGFARPLFRTATSAPAADVSRQVLVLVDRSASMQREGLWAAARARAEAVVRAAGPSDQVALYAFDEQVQPLVTFEQWRSAAAGDRVGLTLGRLAETAPGWSATQLGNALVRAAEVLEESAGEPPAGARQVVLVTDLQDGSQLGGLQAFEWPRHIEVRIESVQPPHKTNAGLQWVTDTAEDDRSAAAASDGSGGVRVRVTNAADSERDQFRFGWFRGATPVGASIEVYVPPGQSRIVPAPPAPAQLAPDRLVLTGDDHAFDNTVFVVTPPAAQVRVLYLGEEAAGDPKQPLYFLQRAFQETRRQVVEVVSQAPERERSDAELASAALIVVAAALPEARRPALSRYLESGKTIVVLLRDASAGPTLAALLNAPGLSLTNAGGSGYSMLAEIDFQHPLFAPFADPRFSDFTKIHFWNHRWLDTAGIASARVLARFDNGHPALVEASRGPGRLLVLTSGWHPADSQLALSSKFVPLLYSLLERAGAAMPAAAQYRVGARLRTVETGKGGTVETGGRGEAEAGREGLLVPREPGIYTVEGARRVAVNLDPAESRTVPLPPETLERLGAPVPRVAPDPVRGAAREARLHHAELESRQKLWRWLIVAALLVLLMESWLAGRMVRPPAATVGGGA